MSQWEVVGGADKGGILVREGQDLKSPQTADRLSTGAIVEEVELIGERLHYKLLIGTGPAEGWVSIRISGKELLVRKEASASASAAPEEPAEVGGPGESTGPVPVDEALKRRVEANAEEKQKEGALLLYVMKYKVLGYPLPTPKLRVFCFHNAGSAESCFTGPGTPFITWAKETKQIEVVAVDYPGRDKLLKHTKHTSTDTLSPELLAVLYDKVADGVPYMVWGHSVGTWVAFEFMILARKIGLPMPLAAFLMAFPAPHMPEAQRPWRRSRLLNENELKEELLNWDKDHFTGAGKVVFDSPGWKETWEPLMRADFQLYDEYKFRHAGAPKFDFPIHAWHFELEHFNKQGMIELWKDWAGAAWDFDVMKGMGHLTCMYKPDLKKEYFQKVTDHMKRYAGL